MSGRMVLIEFEDAEALKAGLARLREAGHTHLETHSPYGLPELDEPLGLDRGWLPLVALIAAGAGATASYAIQFIGNVLRYPQNAGGRPAHAVPSFLFSTIEGTLLAAGVAVFIGLLVTVRLPRLWQPIFAARRFGSTTSSGFWIRVHDLDPADEHELLEHLGALHWETVEAGR